MSNADKQQRIARWLGTNTLGVYVGIETVNWRAPQFEEHLAIPLAAQGADWVAVKAGEYQLWYDDTFAAIRSAFLRHGIGCAPYIFTHPWTWQTDAAMAIHLAQIAGGVILDDEETWVNHGDEHRAMIARIRAACPDACLISSGYGDPAYAFGTGWDFSAITECDAYQPQAYLGYWDIYHQQGWQAALTWADQQCGAMFTRFGLGADYPIQWAINCQGVNAGDMEPLARYLARWNAPLVVWEYQDVTGPELAALKRGLGTPPKIDPTPVPSPDPAPSPPQHTYTVQAGDTLSGIAGKLGIAGGWQTLFDENRDVIADPNRIYPGQVLRY